MKWVRPIMVIISVLVVTVLFAQPSLSTICSEASCVVEIAHEHDCDHDQDKDAHHNCDCSCHGLLSIGVVLSGLEVFSDSSVKSSDSFPQGLESDDFARRLYQPPRLS